MDYSELDKNKPKDKPSERAGEVVELITKPEPMNNPGCEHRWEIDPSETDFIAYICMNEDCGEVLIYESPMV